MTVRAAKRVLRFTGVSRKHFDRWSTHDRARAVLERRERRLRRRGDFAPLADWRWGRWDETRHDPRRALEPPF